MTTYFDTESEIISDEEYALRSEDRRAYLDAVKRGVPADAFEITRLSFPGFDHTANQRAFNLAAIRHFEVIRRTGSIPTQTGEHRGTGVWVSDIRKRVRKGTLTEEQGEFILRNAPDVLTPHVSSNRDKKLSAAQGFAIENPHAKISEYPEEHRNLFSTLRHRLNTAPMSAEEVASIDAICPVWRHPGHSAAEVSGMDAKESASSSFVSRYLATRRVPSMSGFYGGFSLSDLLSTAEDDVFESFSDRIPADDAEGQERIRAIAQMRSEESAREALEIESIEADRERIKKVAAEMADTLLRESKSQIKTRLREHADRVSERSRAAHRSVEEAGYSQFIVKYPCTYENWRRSGDVRELLSEDDAFDRQFDLSRSLTYVCWLTSALIYEVRAYVEENGEYPVAPTERRTSLPPQGLRKTMSHALGEEALFSGFLLAAIDTYLPGFRDVNRAMLLGKEPVLTVGSLPEMPDVVTDEMLSPDAAGGVGFYGVFKRKTIVSWIKSDLIQGKTPKPPKDLWWIG